MYQHINNNNIFDKIRIHFTGQKHDTDQNVQIGPKMNIVENIYFSLSIINY